jgi:TrfA protein
MTTPPPAAAPLLANLEEPPLPEHIQRGLEGHDPIMQQRLKNIYFGMQRREAAEKAAEQTPPQKLQDKPKARIIPFPHFSTETRPIVNEIARSALFSAIQSKDRQMLKDAPVAISGDGKILFTGEQLNQSDHDVFMQLISIGSTRPAGEYVKVTGHSLLKALGRGTSGKEHDQLEAEIKRLVEGSVSIKTKRITYFGHLIHDAEKDEESKHWVFRLNENLLPLFGVNCYTLIDWEQRKQLKGDLACWLQLYLATHADPFPVKVETLHRLSGSRTKGLFKFRQTLKAALDALRAAGHVEAWHIDETDSVHVDRGNAISDSQQRHLSKPRPRRK